MSPDNGKFYNVTVCIMTEDEKTGKLKKKNEHYLIDASDTNMAEKNTFKLMEGVLDDWEIVGINLSNIQEVFIAGQA